MGRPTKYKEEFCERVPEIMRDGASIEEVAVELGVALSTLYLWREKHPEFSEAIKRGEAVSRAWWIKRGRINLENRDFNSTLWYMNMKNRHGWADKVEKKEKRNITITWAGPHRIEDKPIDVTPTPPPLPANSEVGEE